MNEFITLTDGAPGAAVLLGAMVLVSLIGLFAAPGLIERSLFRPHWLVPQHQYFTLLTSAFVHADLTHLLFNAFTFWAFGFALERAIGTPRFLALYVFGLLASDLGTWIKQRGNPAYQTLGASGAITAVLFAAIVYAPTAAIYMLPIPFPIPAPLFAVGYLAYSVYASHQTGGRINHDAHLAGALAGIAFVAVTDFGALERAVRGAVGFG